MSPVNQIAQLRDLLTVLENAPTLSEAPNPTAWGLPGFGAGAARGLATKMFGLGPGTATTITKQVGRRKETYRLEMDVDGTWKHIDGPKAGQKASIDDSTLAAEKATNDIKAGTGDTVVGKTSTTQKLTFGWANSPDKVNFVQHALMGIRVVNTMIITKSAYDSLTRSINQDDNSWMSLFEIWLKKASLIPAVATFLIPVQVQLGIGAVAWIMYNIVNHPLTDEQKASIEKDVRAHLDTPPEQRKNAIDARYWDQYVFVYNKLKASGATQTPAAAGTTATTPAAANTKTPAAAPATTTAAPKAAAAEPDELDALK